MLTRFVVDEGALALFAGYQVGLLQLLECASDGGPADVQVFGDLMLGWELFTGP